MDSELIGKQVLEAIAIQGQIASLGEELSKVQNAIDATKKHEESLSKEKDKMLLAQKTSKTTLKKAEDAVDNAKTRLKEAKKNLTVAEKALEEIKEESSRYDDNSINKIDDAIQVAWVSKQELLRDSEGIAEKIKSVQSELESKLAELAEQGIKLDLGTVKPASKVTYL